MNLIEQLGGYEKCAEYRWALNKMPDVSKIPTTLSELLPAMLQHRRENNIFEVGDAIVRRWNGRVHWIITDIDNGSEFMISENKNAKFKDCKVCDMPCNFTHAALEEIKAGHRL